MLSPQYRSWCCLLQSDLMCDVIMLEKAAPLRFGRLTRSHTAAHRRFHNHFDHGNSTLTVILIRTSTTSARWQAKSVTGHTQVGCCFPFSKHLASAPRHHNLSSSPRDEASIQSFSRSKTSISRSTTMLFSTTSSAVPLGPSPTPPSRAVSPLLRRRSNRTPSPSRNQQRGHDAEQFDRLDLPTSAFPVQQS
ncbi:hypothetical protein EJ06DRAFT_217323 [Trichodelitschia bisporula]|uniref:Uncharacterized protein n=1 Tax=Trichodelitschia bisporula TaxID=703511 RepID=A0A6G1I8W0_9PEZI|nr:hypothetical protein EJ06DRAFT_217323 [Trichodelitschia bisporula]